jgi:hypothetical protein
LTTVRFPQSGHEKKFSYLKAKKQKWYKNAIKSINECLNMKTCNTFCLKIGDNVPEFTVQYSKFIVV